MADESMHGRGSVLYGKNSSGEIRHVVVNDDGEIKMDAEITATIEVGTPSGFASTVNNTGATITLCTAPDYTSSVILKNTGDYDAQYSFNGSTWLELESGCTFGDSWKLRTIQLRAKNSGETASYNIAITV